MELIISCTFYRDLRNFGMVHIAKRYMGMDLTDCCGVYEWVGEGGKVTPEMLLVIYRKK